MLIGNKDLLIDSISAKASFEIGLQHRHYFFKVAPSLGGINRL